MQMRNKPLIFLDMDGVLANFTKAYNSLSPMMDNRKKFRAAVLNHDIFRELEYMPNATKLVNLLFNDLDVDVEILGSLGSHDKEIAETAMRQKKYWLDRKGIHCKQNFVNSWNLKCDHATPFSIMIDDTPGVISSYTEAGGLGVMYIDNNWGDMEFKIRQAVTRCNQLIQLSKDT